jgi:uncharacterized repeat protein (TIGR01451 family)
VGGLAVVLAVVGTAAAIHVAIDTEGHTTLEQILTCSNPPPNPPNECDRSLQPYDTLEVEQVNKDFLERDADSVDGTPQNPNPAIPKALAARANRRVSLAYFSQMTDFQLADEESPARVEFLDPGPSSAWRPWEAFNPFMIDATVRQLNSLADASPVPQAGGARGNAMDFALITGDQADNNQRNETAWVRELLEGGRPLNFNTGITDPAFYLNTTNPDCLAFREQQAGLTPSEKAANAAAEAARYTGVQDFDDYDESQTPLYYDPDDVRGSWATDRWPTYKGLMDRAQTLTITPEGLDVPFYITNGNHDVLVQGNEDAVAAFEQIALGCRKMLASTAEPSPGVLDPNVLLAPPDASTLVPPDTQRQFVSKKQIKQIYGATIAGDDNHGFAHVAPAENQASNGAASYYAWNPPQTPGLRFVSIDTNSEGGQTAEGVGAGSSNGNIDDPQFKWLERELVAATRAGKLIVIFGHHPVRSMNTEIKDEQAPQCTGADDGHGHDPNPGCDADPRISEPIHLGQDPQPGDPRVSFVELLERYPNVIAYVPGHTHENRVTRFIRKNDTPATSDDTVWWELNTSAVADHPQQSRLIDIMDNRDGTLSIFSAVVDHASPATAPDGCSTPNCAAAFGGSQLASIGRTFAYNDPQSGHPNGEGGVQDQNVELLVDDPRRANLKITKLDDPDPVRIGRVLTYKLKVENLGPSRATAVTVRDRLPNQLQLVSAETSRGSCSASGGVVTCRLGNMGAVVGKQQVVIRARVQGGPRTIANTATVASITDDPAPLNNRDTESTRVTP